MYNEVLSYTYLEAREVYPQFTSMSKERKIVSMKNEGLIDSFTNDSDIIVYYDMIEDSPPLLLIERLCLKESGICKGFFNRGKLQWKVRKFHKEITDYYISLEKSKLGNYLDIIVVKKNIIDNIQEE